MHNWIQENSKMKDAVESTLEQITFTLVQEMSEQKYLEPVGMTESFISCTLETGERISLCFSLQHSFLERIVADLYPYTEDFHPYLQDTLDELANTIAGNFFRSIENQLGNFQLSIPYKERPEQWNNDVIFPFILDDLYPLFISICA